MSSDLFAMFDAVCPADSGVHYSDAEGASRGAVLIIATLLGCTSLSLSTARCRRLAHSAVRPAIDLGSLFYRILHLVLFSPHLASFVRHIPLIPLLPVFALLALLILLTFAITTLLMLAIYAAGLTADMLARDQPRVPLPLRHEHLRRALYLLRLPPLPFARSLKVAEDET